MKLTGIEIKNFRSIGSMPVIIKPLKKCNIFVGQNNVGKSNVCKAIRLISDSMRSVNDGVTFNELDRHGRVGGTPFIFKLWFEFDPSHDTEKKISALIKSNEVWFEFRIDAPSSKLCTNNMFADIVKDFDQSNSILDILLNQHWTQRVHLNIIQKDFLEKSQDFYNRLFPEIPPVDFIPEFRQINSGNKYEFNGTGLVEMLARYQSPDIFKDEDRNKFEKIQEFARNLIHIPEAQLDISRDKSELIIKNGNLRLPISHYGTGIHELIILVTAVLTTNNSICCIEEPEIHLHPRLQKELIEFLVDKTENKYIISSHSPTLINIGETHEAVQIFHLTLSEGDTIGGPVISEKECLSALYDLGIKASDLLQANCIIWVEGVSDRNYFNRWLELLAPDLRESRDYIYMYYRTLPKLEIGRDAPENGILNVLSINQNMILIMDSDKKSENDTAEINKTKLEMIHNCESSGGICLITKGKEIENYLPSRVIIAACKELRGGDIEINCSPFHNFDSEVDKSLRKAGLPILDYAHNKKMYSKKFAEDFQPSDFTNELRDDVNKIIFKIREWKS